MSNVTLAYKRDDGAETSSGEVLIEQEKELLSIPFEKLSFQLMLSQLCRVLRGHSVERVVVQRTDREGLVPYVLDQKTVDLIREDPIAAAEAMTFRRTNPSTAIKRARERSVVIHPQPIRVGFDVLSEAFGDDVYFRVRGHELECPGCGFWSPFTTPGLLNDPERAGGVFKTVFICRKKCQARFVVSCWEKWGSVPVDYLLEKTKLELFYLPRPWNLNPNRGGWITRADLKDKFEKYNKEMKSCSTTT